MARKAVRSDVAPDNGARLDRGVLGDVLGFHIRMAQVAIYRDFATSMAAFALTQKQFAVLELIARNPGVSQIDLAAALGTDRATMMALVDRLDQRGLIARRVSQADRRRQELALTGAGMDLLTAARARVAEHEQRFQARFSEGELAQLVAGLKRIYQEP